MFVLVITHDTTICKTSQHRSINNTISSHFLRDNFVYFQIHATFSFNEKYPGCWILDNLIVNCQYLFLQNPNKPVKQKAMKNLFTVTRLIHHFSFRKYHELFFKDEIFPNKIRTVYQKVKWKCRKRFSNLLRELSLTHTNLWVFRLICSCQCYF